MKRNILDLLECEDVLTVRKFKKFHMPYTPFSFKTRIDISMQEATCPVKSIMIEDKSLPIDIPINGKEKKQDD